MPHLAIPHYCYHMPIVLNFTDDLSEMGSKMRIHQLILSVLLMIAPSSVIYAQPDTDAMTMDAPGVVISEVWGRATVAATMDMDDTGEMSGEMDMEENADDEMSADMDMGGTSAVYMTVTNPTETELRLVAAATDAASIVEIHETSLGDGDVMRMRPVDGGLLVPAGESVELRPGGFHIMLLEPEPLAPGAAFALTLTFEDAEGETADVLVGVPVLDLPPMSQPSIRVDATSVWARPTIAQDMDEMMMTEGGTSAVYMDLTNLGSEADALVSASTPAAGIVEIHETSMGEGDVMRMRPVEGGIPLPPDESVSLRPGGYHVMLLEPDALQPGDAVALTLTFESGQEALVAAVVEDRTSGGMSMDMDDQ